MADIELVIKIPDEIYEQAINGTEYDTLSLGIKLRQSVREGIVIPKGHGRLIDASYLLNLLKCEEYESCTWRNCSACNQEKCIKKYDILEAPTIIKAESEDKG